MTQNVDLLLCKHDLNQNLRFYMLEYKNDYNKAGKVSAHLCYLIEMITCKHYLRQAYLEKRPFVSPYLYQPLLPSFSIFSRRKMMK